MVARKRGAESPIRAVAREAFGQWRRLLARTTAGARRVLLPRGNGAGRTARLLEALTCEPLVTAGVAALLTGAVLHAVMSREPVWVATAGLVSTVVLAVVRLVVLALTMPRAGAPRPDIVRAWATGLIVWIAAIDPLASVVCWAVSAPITWSALRRAGVHGRSAAHAVALAWGAHALIAAALWLMRSIAVGIALG